MIKKMKKTLTILILLVTLYLNAQKEKISKKTYTAYVGSVCEEVDFTDSCAGYETFLVLKFKKDEVVVIEKNISSCNRETIVLNHNYKWKLINNEIQIAFNKNEIKSSYFDDLKIEIRNNKIIGSKKAIGGKIIKYQFLE